MKQSSYPRGCWPLCCTIILLLCLLLAGCGEAIAQPEPPTPTPLAPAPELERPTYIVERGSIARTLEATGRVTPVDLVRLGFAESGRVAELRVARGDSVKAGDLLASLNQEAAIAALQQAELAVTSAERDLQAARIQRDIGIEQAQLRRATARENLQRFLDNPVSPERVQAQDAIDNAQRTLETTQRTAAATKAETETAVEAAADAVVAAQELYSDAYWANEQSRDGPNAQAAADSFAAAERDLRTAERGRENALLALDEARRAEIEQLQAAEAELARAERDLARLTQLDQMSASVAQARQALAEAELSLKAAQQTTFARELNALDAARLSFAQAQGSVAAGQIVAPQDGAVVALALQPGDEVTAFAPLIEIANLAALEIAAELTAEQLRDLAASQLADVRLLSRPDLALPARIRRLPVGGSGVVRAEDRTTRFQITDLRGQALAPGAVARVRMVIEQRDGVLLLPPEALRAFEGRRFVIVREGARERRVPVRVGIETPERVEILEGLRAGDIVVGP